MRIPSKALEREAFYLDIMAKCLVSRDERKPDYTNLRSYYLFGAGPDDVPAIYNKIYPHLDQLTSFLYSAETTRFSINLGASVPSQEHRKIPVLTQALNDEWLNSNCDQVFSTALTWSLVYNSTFIKLIYNNGIHPYMVEPGAMGVLREDSPYLDRQEALVQTYYITKSELMARLYSHPKRDEILKRITASYNAPISDVPNGVDRIVLSSSNPTMMGNINLDLYGYNRYKASVAEDTVEMRELWLWNDETMDYQVITMANPDTVIYDRPGASVFLKGELPFIQICPNAQYDYFWGQSECQRLINLQLLRNNRMNEILDLLSKQVAPPTALMGFSGILDEKNFALNRAGGLLSTDMPNAKVEKLAPTIPPDLYESIRALVVEDALEKVATLYLKLMQAYDGTHFKDTENVPFVAEQFTGDFTVKVDAHSNSPIFTEDLRQLAFNLFKAQAIDKESLLDLLEPPMKQELKERLKKMEEKQAAAAAQQAAQPKPEKGGGKPDLKAVGGE